MEGVGEYEVTGRWVPRHTSCICMPVAGSPLSRDKLTSDTAHDRTWHEDSFDLGQGEDEDGGMNISQDEDEGDR